MATMTQDSTTKLWTLSDTITQPGSYTKTLETKDTYLDGNVKLDLTIDIKPKPAANTIKYGTTILGVQGTLLSDTDIADATSPLVRNGYEFWNHDGDRLYGSMPDSTLGVCADTSHTAALTIDPSTNDQYFKVSEGYTPTRCIKVNKMGNATIILNHANCTISTSASILPTVTLATTKTAGKGYKVNISGSQIITGSHTGGAITLDSTTVAGYITKDSTVTVKAGHTDTISGTATITDPEFYIPEGGLVVSQANCTYAASAAITPTVSLATTKTANGYKVNISGSQAITGTHSGGAITLDSTTTSGYITNGSSITVKAGHTDTITGNATINDPDFYIPAGEVACTLNEGTRSISGGYLNIPVTASHSFTAGYIPTGTGSGGTATPKVKVYDGSIA